MATPSNLLEQLVMGLQKPVADDQPVFPENTAPADQVLAALLAQSLQPGESVPPANIVRGQLANDLGITEEDLTLNLLGTQNLMQLGDPEIGSLLQGVAQDQGLPVEDMRQLVRGNVNLANVTAAEQEQAAQVRTDVARGASLIPEPTKDEVLEGLLAEARGVTERADPDATAAFQNKLGQLMRSPDATPAERTAAYQLRHPDMHVEMQPDGVMSFSDKGPGLQPKDEATRRAVENVRAKLTTLSPNQAIVAGEGSEIAALSAANRQKLSDRAIDAKAKLFGAPTTKAMADIQTTLQGIVNIDDPNERYLALQRLGPSIAAYGNQRRSEIRNDVFNDLGIHELERSLAEHEARDRADPLWDKYQRDSSYTASLRNQLRQIKTDALVRIDEQLKSDPMLNTLRSQTDMTEALVRRLDEKDMNYQLPDVIDSMPPDAQTRTKAAVKALNPNANVDSMGSSELAKIMKTDPGFYEAVVALGDGNESTMISSMVLDKKNANKWRSYIKQLELEAGADDATAEALTKDYVNYANSAQLALTGGMSESELKQQGGAVVQLVERWEEEKKDLTASEAAQRMGSYYIPKIIEAKLDFRQTQFIDEADREIKDLKPDTGNEKVDRLLQEAKDKGFALGDLLKPHKLASLESSDSELGGSLLDKVLSYPNLPYPLEVKPSKRVGILFDQEARVTLARYIAGRRKERMMRTAFFEPLDTFESLNRQLNTMAVTGTEHSIKF